MKRALAFMLLGLIAGLGGWFAGRQWRSEGPSGRAGAAADGGGSDSVVNLEDPVAGSGPVALGWLEPANGVVEISGPPGDQLESIVCCEGNVVEQGATLLTLRSRTQREIEVQSAECQLREAVARREAESLLADARIRKAQLRVREIGLQDLDVASLHRRIGLLQRNRDLAQNQLQRLQNLNKPGQLVGLSDPLVTDQELERQQLAVQQVQAELATAEGDLEKLTRTRQLAEDMARAELDAAEASKQQVLAAIPTESLQRGLELSQELLAETTIKAPTKGTILRVFMEPGEAVGNRPILHMADLGQMVAVAEVYETDVWRLRLQQPAIVTSPAFPRRHDRRGLRGRIIQIGRTVSTPQLKNIDPLARSDRHVIPIRVKLDDNDIRQAADFVNLQVVVTFPEDRE